MPSALGTTTRLTLRPATPVLARSPGVLQVGLDEPHARLPDEPAVRRLLRDLARPGGAAAETDDLAPVASAALTALREAGLVVAMLPSERVADQRLAVLRAQFGPDAVRRQAGRAAAAVVVRADPVIQPVLDPLLAAAGLRTTTSAEDPGAVQLVAVTGPVARESLDPLTRGSVPHLVLAGSAAGLRLGPFVDPGRTACQRCVDAHEALHDERRPLLLTQAAAAAADRPPPRDRVLDQLAAAWAVRDLVRYVEGDEPSTWSATVDMGPTSGPVLTRWGRHPYCGCSWDAMLELP